MALNGFLWSIAIPAVFVASAAASGYSSIPYNKLMYLNGTTGNVVKSDPNQQYGSDLANAAATSDECSSRNEIMIRTVTIPLSAFTFKFAPSNGIERHVFLATVFCGMPIPVSVYIEHARGGQPVYDGNMRVYDMGIGIETYVDKANSARYYQCSTRLSLGSDVGRVCTADVNLEIGFSRETGKSLMVRYGIDYDNKDHIFEINSALKSYFMRLHSL